jgi:hypothetical protein
LHVAVLRLPARLGPRGSIRPGDQGIGERSQCAAGQRADPIDPQLASRGRPPKTFVERELGEQVTAKIGVHDRPDGRLCVHLRFM